MIWGNLLYRATGLMTNSVIKQKCADIGVAAAEIASHDSAQKANEISQIVTKALGKKASKVKMTTDKDEFIRLLQEQTGASKESAESFYNTSASSVIPANSGDSTILCLRIEDMPIENIANVTAHEFEHTLFDVFSPMSKFSRFLLNCPYIGKKIIEKEFQKMDTHEKSLRILENVLIINIGKLGTNAISGTVKYPATTEGLVKQCGCKDINELRLKIREALYEYGVLKFKDEKINKGILDFIPNNFKDEARAYAAGGKAQKVYMDMMGTNIEENATKSEMLSMLYKEAIDVMNQELKLVKKNLKLIKHKKAPDRSFENLVAQRIAIKYIANESAKINPKITFEAIKKYSKELGVIYNELNKKAQSAGKQYAENSEFIEATVKFFEGKSL